MKTRKRCPNGYHKNIKTKKCLLHKNKKSISNSINILSSLKNDKIAIAIIVPFRDLTKTKERMRQLHIFMKYMTNFMNMTMTEGKKWKIFIIEQSNDGRKFNRGKLLNIGFKESLKEKYNFFIFHDVDLLPSKEMIDYYMIRPPINQTYHIASVWNRYGSNPSYFGGITAFNAFEFEKINGYPNNFWGWGGEDDELYKRIIDNNIIIKKANKGSIKDLENLNILQKKNVLNKNGEKFLFKWEALALHNTTWMSNGLNSLKYKIIERKCITENGKKHKKENCKIELIKVNVMLNHDDNDKYIK